MDNTNSIIQYALKDYGCVKVKLADVMVNRGITRNRLRTLTGVKYDVINRYYQGVNITMIDLDFVAKVCCVLNCHINDILEYVPPSHD